MISKKKFNLCIIGVSVIVLISICYYYYNRSYNNKNKQLFVENFNSNEQTINSNNLITNGSFSSNKNINQNSSSSGSNLIIKYSNNPGQSAYVLQQEKTNKKTKIFYEMVVPVKKNSYYVLSFWVSLIGNNKPINYSTLVYARIPKSDSSNYIPKLTYKKLKQQNNNGVVWSYISYYFTSPSDAMDKMYIYLNYTKNLQAKKILFTDISLNIILSDSTNFKYTNKLVCYLDSYDSKTKILEDKSNSGNKFLFSNTPYYNSSNGSILTINNTISGPPSQQLFNPTNTSIFNFTTILVFSNKTIYTTPVPILTIPCNTNYSLEISVGSANNNLYNLYCKLGDKKIYIIKNLVFTNKTLLFIEYNDQIVNIYQDSRKIFSSDNKIKLYLDNDSSKKVMINRLGINGDSKNLDANFYGFLVYNTILTEDTMNGIRKYFITNQNQSDTNSTLPYQIHDAVPDQNNTSDDIPGYGTDIYTDDNQFQNDFDNGINQQNPNGLDNPNDCMKDCNELCQPFMNESMNKLNECYESCKYTKLSCQNYCKKDENKYTLFCKGQANNNVNKCPIAYKRKGKYYIYIEPGSKYAIEFQFSGEKSYGKNREGARRMYELNFPGCEVPDILLPGGGENYLDKCPFVIKENNPCYSRHCAGVDWSKKNPKNQRLCKACKKTISHYCSINSEFDDACVCWKDEYRNLDKCIKFRRQYEHPNDYQCNINQFNIYEHPDFNKYIRKDKIPCWNCNLDDASESYKKIKGR